MPNAATPYFLRPGDTELPEGPDKSLEPTFPPTDPARRTVAPLEWARLDLSKGPIGPPDRPAGPPPVDPAIRSLEPFSWPQGYPTPNRPLGELVANLPDLDPDIALWPQTILSRWPFPGHPTVGIWPKGWLGVDNTATVWVCTASGEPGTWAIVGSGTGGPFMPIANAAGTTTGTETPDPIAATNSANWVKFPSNASVMAWGLATDAFPRVVFAADPTDAGAFGAIMLGDGTFDPTRASSLESPVTLALNTVGSHRGPVPRLGGAGDGGNATGAIIGVGPCLTTLDVAPTGILPGETGDVVIEGSSLSGPGSSFWVCATAGSSLSAVWDLRSVISSTDPISAAVTPPNAGALWQDTSGSGSLWISTGTAPGAWAQIWPLPHASGSAGPVAGTGSTQTLITTPSLAVGLWKIDAVLEFSSTTLGHNASLTAAAGTASATFSGGNSTACSVPGSAEPNTCAISVLANVTAAGTVLIQTVANAAGTILEVGYTAVKIG